MVFPGFPLVMGKAKKINLRTFQAEPRWVETVFNKRECIKFIPSSKDNARWVAVVTLSLHV